VLSRARRGDFGLYSGGATGHNTGMKKSLSHLPKHKRNELKVVTRSYAD
jgi:hypothetical protein